VRLHCVHRIRKSPAITGEQKIFIGIVCCITIIARLREQSKLAHRSLNVLKSILCQLWQSRVAPQREIDQAAIHEGLYEHRLGDRQLKGEVLSIVNERVRVSHPS
jgi:hypothetical protein